MDDRWREIYERHRPTLYRGAAILVGSSEAEEVVQEAFERALRQEGFFEEIRNCGAWLRATTTRIALDRIRRRAVWTRLRVLLLDRDSAPGAFDDSVIELHDALRCLAPKSRAAVVLKYYYRFDHREIAAVLEMAETSIGSLLARARTELKESLR